MNANILKFYIILLLPCLLIAGNSQAKSVVDRSAIVPAIQTNFGRDGHPQRLLVELVLTAQSEALLQATKIKNKLEAANLAYQQSILAVTRKAPGAAYNYLQEAVQLNPSNLDYLQPASRLAFTLERYDEAEMYQVMVVNLANATMQPPDYRMANLLDDLAGIYVKQWRLEEAESLVRQGLALREQTLGEMNPWVAVSLEKIASLKMQLDEPDEIEALLMRSLHILQTASGKEHSHAAWAMHKLADFYGSQQRFAQAERLYQRAITIWQADSEDRRLDLAASLKGLGELYVAQERLDDARMQFEKMLAALQQVLDEEHPAIDAARDKLGRLDQELHVRQDQAVHGADQSEHRDIPGSNRQSRS
jgi:tetratricopeptide (TPR) repeat protein